MQLFFDNSEKAAFTTFSFSFLNSKYREKEIDKKKIRKQFQKH